MSHCMEMKNKGLSSSPLTAVAQAWGPGNHALRVALWAEWSKGRNWPGFWSLTGLLAAIWKHCGKFPCASTPLVRPPPLKAYLLPPSMNSSEGGVAAWNCTDTTLNHQLHAPAQLLAYFRGSFEHCITVFEQLGGQWMTRSQSGSCWDCVCFSSMSCALLEPDISFIKKRRTSLIPIPYKMS